MQSLFIEELLRLFFNNCKNNPELFVSNFNNSQRIIGYNYRCDQQTFTHVSASFKRILGYHPQNILSSSKFTTKIIHPQDRKAIMDCLRRIYQVPNDLSQKSGIFQFTQRKCRAKHIRGYWKYFMVYGQDYWNDIGQSSDKIGVIVDERIRSSQNNENKPTDDADSDDTNMLYPEFKNKKIATDSRTISPRENEILELISNGLVTKEIANQLHISDSTVITHRKNLIQKLKVRNTAELIKKASKHMLI